MHNPALDTNIIRGDKLCLDQGSQMSVTLFGIESLVDEAYIVVLVACRFVKITNFNPPPRARIE